MPEAEGKKFESWALLELFGHRQLVGLVRDEVLFGDNFCRIDVLGPDGNFVATQRYGSKAVYCVTELTEEAARERVKPYTPPGYQLAAGGDNGGSGDPDDDATDLPEQEDDDS